MTTRGGGIRALRPSYSVLIGKLLSVLGDVRVAKIYAMVLYIHCGVCLYITYLCEFSYLLVCIMFFSPFVLQPSSCLSDREEDEIYGLTTAERRFAPVAAAAARPPPVHLTTAAFRQRAAVQQP